MQERVLIVGGSGFIGSHLTGVLEQSEIEFCSISRTSAGCSNEILMDLTQSFDWEQLLNDFQTVIFLANVGDLKAGSYESENLSTLKAVFSAAISAEVKKFIYVSSIGVCGNVSELPVTQESPYAPYDVYTKTKVKCERLLSEMADGQAISLSIVRPPMVYGEKAGGTYKMLCGLLSRCVVVPFGRIKNRKSFVSVYNLVDFLVYLIEYEGESRSVYIPSDSETISTSDFISAMGRELGHHFMLIYFPEFIFRILLLALNKSVVYQKVFGSMYIDADVDNAGWKPPFSIAKSLRMSVRK